MEQGKKAIELPLSLIVLDAVGAIFVGLGVAKMFANIDFLPAAYQLDDKGWTFIVIGIMWMLPMLLHLFVKVREQAEKKLNK